MINQPDYDEYNYSIRHIGFTSISPTGDYGCLTADQADPVVIDLGYIFDYQDTVILSFKGITTVTPSYILPFRSLTIQPHQRLTIETDNLHTALFIKRYLTPTPLPVHFRLTPTN